MAEKEPQKINPFFNLKMSLYFVFMPNSSSLYVSLPADLTGPDVTLETCSAFSVPDY